MTDIKKILFPIDLTENSSKILPHVLLVSEKYNSMICLLHMSEDLRFGYRVYVPDFSHGRKGLEQVFFGSVAENVVKKSPVPVMTVNPHKVK